MSSWKTVQRKKKRGGRRGGGQSRGGGGGGGGRALPARNRRNRSQSSQGSQEQAPARLPIGASGAPKKARQLQQRRRRRGGAASSRPKKYTNEDQYEVQNAWFDPNLLHNPEEQTSYADEEADEKIPRSLADKIRRNRERLGMSRDEFSQAINERPNVVAQYEMAQVSSNTRVLKKMARVLGVSLGQKAGRQHRKARDERFYRT